MAPKLKKNQKKKPPKKSPAESYLADDENFHKFSSQLAKMGLALRDITSDGNCCFRALSDQLQGTEEHHADYRRRVCLYMKQHRGQFEPFVAALIEDDDDDDDDEKSSQVVVMGRTRQASKQLRSQLDSFDLYIKHLEESGTYADNGCLVAFARLYQVDINIHQLDLDIWTIHGTDMTLTTTSSSSKDNKRNPIPQIHLSYHNGEHYSSIRPIGDNSNKPTSIYFAENRKKSTPTTASAASRFRDDDDDDFADYPFYSNDNNEDCNNNFLSAAAALNETNASSFSLDHKIEQIIEITKCFDISLIKSKLDENENNVDLTIDAVINSNNNNDNDSTDVEDKPKTRPVKSDKKNEKKERQMERQRLKVLEQRERQPQLNTTAQKNLVRVDELEEKKVNTNNLNVQTKSI
jgi:OTU domain-containing protein 3